MYFLKSSLSLSLSLCSEPVALAWHRRQERKEKPYFTKILRIGSAKTAELKSTWQIIAKERKVTTQEGKILIGRTTYLTGHAQFERYGIRTEKVESGRRIYEMKNIVIELIPPTKLERIFKKEKKKKGEFFLVLSTNNKTLSPSKNLFNEDPWKMSLGLLHWMTGLYQSIKSSIKFIQGIGRRGKKI